MATVNLGAIKFNWKGAYNNATAYVADDVVSSGGNSYVCILASTGNAVSISSFVMVLTGLLWHRQGLMEVMVQTLV